jgi:hypothetical protein
LPAPRQDAGEARSSGGEGDLMADVIRTRSRKPREVFDIILSGKTVKLFDEAADTMSLGVLCVRVRDLGHGVADEVLNLEQHCALIRARLIIRRHDHYVLTNAGKRLACSVRMTT